MSCWRSNRASQNPSRPASKATQTRRTTRPARRDSSRQRSINLNSCSGSGASFFSGSRASPGARAATSQLDWLISMTTINVLSCSRAVRDLLTSKGLDMERSIVGLTAAMVHYFRRPPHSISPARAGEGRLPLVAGRTEVHGPLGGVVHFLGREQHDGLDGDGAALLCRQRDSGGGRGVGQVDNDIRVDIAEGEIERLQFSAQPFGHLRDGRAAARAPVLGDALGALNRVSRLQKIFGHVGLLREARRRNASPPSRRSAPANSASEATIARRPLAGREPLGASDQPGNRRSKPPVRSARYCAKSKLGRSRWLICPGSAAREQSPRNTFSVQPRSSSLTLSSSALT